jgi:drug/metabolite transporter (DMT)-like permease
MRRTPVAGLFLCKKADKQQGEAFDMISHEMPQRKASSAVAYGLLTLTALMWAGNAIAGKYAVGHVSPYLLTSLRWIVATAILVVWAWPQLRRDLAAMRQHAAYLFAMGALGFGIFNDLFYLALLHTSAINVAILQSSMPLAVFALNFALHSIRATGAQLAGFGLTLVGVALTATQGNLLAVGAIEWNFGDILMLVAIALYGAYSVGLARKPAMHWLSFLTAASAGAVIASLPFTIWEIAAGTVIYPDAQGWAVTFYTAVGPAIIAQLCWARGLEIIGSNRGGIFINIVPVFTAALAIALLGEAFLAYHALAMLLVFAGVWLSQRRPG